MRATIPAPRHPLAWLFWPYLALIATIAALAWWGALPIGEIGWLDKVGHFVMVGLLAALLDLWLRGRTLGPVPWAIVVIGLVSVIDEAAQSWSPNRTFDALDLLANVGGVALLVTLGRAARRARHTSSRARLQRS